MNRNASRLGLLLAATVAFTAWSAAALAECTPTQLADARQAYDTAYAFVQQGKWATSVRHLNKAVASCPEHWDSRELLGQAYLRTKKYPEAVEQYAAVMDGKYGGDPVAAEARELQGYGFALLKAGDTETAEAVYLALHEKDPTQIEPLQRLVYIYEKNKDYNSAVDFEVLLYELDPSNHEYARKIGDLYKKAGDTEMANEYYKVASEGGVVTKGAFDVGKDHMNAGRYADAAISFRHYLQGKPDSAAAWQNLGFCLDKMADKRGAIEAYEKAVALAPDRHSVASGLGFLYVDLNRIDDAELLAQDAISNWPKDDNKLKSMYYLMGRVREQQGRYREAIDMFDVASDDPYWGEYAVQQIERQRQLIARDEALKQQAERDGE